MDDIQALKPTALAVVPRILTRVYSKIYEGITAKGGFTKNLFDRAVDAKFYYFY